ncbi:MAG: hypothetical protein SF053_01660 [Bacteroidia bacterium]|nr:hypothetical protein [Bacteroidia bacterium]
MQIRKICLLGLMVLSHMVTLAQPGDANPLGDFWADFCTSLNHYVQEAPDGFVRSRGEAQADGGNLTCKFPIPGAQDCYLVEDQQGQFTLVGIFEETPDSLVAGQAYSALISLINSCPLACCKLIFEETRQEYFRTTYWVNLDITGSGDPVFDHLLLEVRQAQLMRIHPEHGLQQVYIVALNIGIRS